MTTHPFTEKAVPKNGLAQHAKTAKYISSLLRVATNLQASDVEELFKEKWVPLADAQQQLDGLKEDIRTLHKEVMGQIKLNDKLEGRLQRIRKALKAAETICFAANGDEIIMLEPAIVKAVVGEADP